MSPTPNSRSQKKTKKQKKGHLHIEQLASESLPLLSSTAYATTILYPHD
jgi:hypothetical protein